MVLNGGNEYIQDPILDSEDMKKLFVSKIPLDVSDVELQAFFENISGGSVTEKSIVRKKDAKTYHYGYLTFETSNLVDEIIFMEKELIINGTTLEVNRAPPKQTGGYHKTKKIFIGSIPKTGLTEEELKKYLEDRHDPKYGTIESVQFIKKKDDEGKPTEENKGFGFVNVSSEHLADTMSIQHASIEINGNKLELKKSDRDGQGGQRGGRGGLRGGQRGGQRGGRGGQHSRGYDGYGGYGGGWSGYGGYGGYSYGVYPQYGVSSSVRGRGGARGGKDARGGARGGRGGARGGRGKRFTPYSKAI